MPVGRQQKFENIEAAIHALKETCNYLHRGMRQLERVIGGKANGNRVQELTGTMAALIDQIRQPNGQLAEISKRADVMSSNVEGVSKRIADLQPDGACQGWSYAAR